MQKIALATLVCLLALTVTAFADEKQLEVLEVKLAEEKKTTDGRIKVTTVETFINSDGKKEIREVKKLVSKDEPVLSLSAVSVMLADQQRLLKNTAIGVKKAKRVARAVYFPKDKFSVRQFGGFGLLAQMGKLDDSEAGQAAQMAAIISGESVSIQASAYSLLLPLIQQVEGEVSFSAILEGDMDDTADKQGVWLILYGHEETVTELTNVLETIAKGAPEKQKPEGSENECPTKPNK